MKKNIKIKKPEGGVLTNSSGAALPNSINQTGGNSGAAVVDPYSFSVQHGVTTLTPLQWKKLDAGQQQVIWRQAFDKAGFINTSEGNYLATKEQANMFSDGGQIFSQVSGAISPIVNMIPGVGPIINAGLSLANMGISMNQKEATVERAKEVLPMNQGIYGYKKGGNLAGRKKYFKGYEAEGEEIVLGNADINQTDKSSVGGIIKGASHKNGGVDGVGGEYIISDRWGIDGSYKEDNPNSLANAAAPIMKSIAKLEKRKGDNVDRLTLGLLKQKIGQFKQLNDKFLEQEQQEVMAKGGKLKYYAGGPNLVPDSYFRDAPKSMDANKDIVEPKLGGLTNLDYAGMGISALSSGLQIANTIKEYKRNKIENPNTNYFANFGENAENTYRDSLKMLDANKMATARDINESAYPILTTQQGNSINVDRAIKANIYTQKNKSIANSNLAYDTTKAQGMQGLSQLQANNENMRLQGEQFKNEFNRQDVAQYFQNLGVNMGNAAELAMQAVGIANKAKSQSQALQMLKSSFPNYTIEQINGMLQVIYKK